MNYIKIEPYILFYQRINENNVQNESINGLFLKKNNNSTHIYIFDYY